MYCISVVLLCFHQKRKIIKGPMCRFCPALNVQVLHVAKQQLICIPYAQVILLHTTQAATCTHTNPSLFPSREKKLDGQAWISFWNIEISASHWVASRPPGIVG